MTLAIINYKLAKCEPLGIELIVLFFTIEKLLTIQKNKKVLTSWSIPFFDQKMLVNY
jgi:hypothetical protein